MCGFAGFLITDTGRADNNTSPAMTSLASRMAKAISHRGPDDDGTWVDQEAGIAMGFRRLSIVELSAAGHQPMQSNSGRYVIVFNGEIYNHMELRLELTGLAWRGYSDTETLLSGIEAWGVEETLKKTVGMFAIALWDKQTRTLHLARDRFGEKPMYYGWVGAGAKTAFLFGSELKAMRAHPLFANSVSREALSLYMRFNYVPAPHSIYQNIFKLEPGCLLSIDAVTLQNASVMPVLVLPPLSAPAKWDALTLKRWWNLDEVVQTASNNQFTNESQALIALEQRLKDAVRLQSLADVPLGAFLSGGIDSSSIVAFMQQQSSQAVKTFTVGFEETGFDESLHARTVARHLGTDHSELFVTAAEAQALIPNLPAMYDEPFADSSQIPTHLVCKAARQKVTVALSGDAGDELFGGYNRYFWGPRIWSHMSWLPQPVRRTLGAAIRAIPPAGWNALSSPLNAFLPGSQGITRIGEKAHKLATLLTNVHNMDELYNSLVSEWKDPAQVVKADNSPYHAIYSLLDDSLPPQSLEQPQLLMMYRDSTTYLPDDILCKVDRAAMAIGLETRIPFLDHRVVELAWQLPLHMKIRGNEGKWALRQILYKYVPREMIDRPKSGFGIPLGNWLRGPLRDWAEELIDEQRLQSEGYFHPGPIRFKWIEHQIGKRDHTSSLWAVLMFQVWLQEHNTQATKQAFFQ